MLLSGFTRKPSVYAGCGGFAGGTRYSRASFRFVVWKSSHQIWAELPERALRYLGGCPQYVVLDNLKEGVIKPDLHEP
jgi:transposase